MPTWSSAMPILPLTTLLSTVRMTPRRHIEEAQEHKLDGDFLHLGIYLLAFLKGDAAEMERQVAWAAGKPGTEDLLLSFQSDTEAYYGRLEERGTFPGARSDAAVRDNSKETAAMWQVNAALREAEFGNVADARSRMSPQPWR